MFSADADIRLARRIKRDTADNARDIGAVLDQVATLQPHQLRFHFHTLIVFCFFCFAFAFVFLTFTAFQDLDMLF